MIPMSGKCRERVRILHLVNDEKFIPFAMDVFGACDGAENKFVATVPDQSKPLRYCAGLQGIRAVDKRYLGSSAMDSDLRECDCLVVHYMDPLKARIVLRAPPELPVVWSGWGGDYWDLISRDRLLGPETSALQSRQVTEAVLRAGLWRLPLSAARHYALPQVHGWIIRRAANRVDLFSAPVPEDYEELAAALQSGFSADYIQLNYASLEKTFAQGQPSSHDGNILVGNSASATNNHLEVFRTLSQLELGQRKVIVPLSYGDERYRDAIVASGHKMLGRNFRPLVEFMSLDRYNELIGSCSVVVMGHRRQQAVGNTATMLYRGAKVFLDKASTVYQFFRRRGAAVYALDDLESSSDALNPLMDAQKEKNLEVLREFWGHERVLNNVQCLVGEIRRRQADA